MLQESGFEVTAVDESFFNKDIVNHHVLFPPILSKKPLATNYRKIFLGRRYKQLLTMIKKFVSKFSGDAVMRDYCEQADKMEITEEIKEYIDKSLLCWLAIVSMKYT